MARRFGKFAIQLAVAAPLVILAAPAHLSHFHQMAAIAAGKAPVKPLPEATTSTTPISSNDPSLIPLTKVIGEKLSGLGSEDPGAVAQYKTQADKYLRFRYGSASERAGLTSECKSSSASSNLFCDLVVEPDAPKKGFRDWLGKRRAAQEQAKILKLLRAGRYVDLAGFSEGELISAFKKVSKFDDFRKAADAVVGMTSCTSNALMMAVGVKLEEAFPEDSDKKRAKALYGRTIQCATDKSTIKAAYRLGLIHLWDKEYKEAEQAFSKIHDLPEAIDYRSRVTYWRMTAVKGQKDLLAKQEKADTKELAALNELERKMKDTLLREYPLSLHALLVDTSTDRGEGTILKPVEPKVLYRSRSKPELAVHLRRAEALLALDTEGSKATQAKKLAFESLVDAIDEVKGAEPQLQLYVAVLLMRSGDTLKKFGLMSNLFRENPEYISKATLEMMYPLRRYDMVQAAKPKMDPLLVLSLIRQESAFNDNARSPAGARGLMQLMPTTARRLARVSTRQLLDPQTNIRLGVKYFGMLVDRYNGDVELALAAYNAGAEKVDGWLKRYPVGNRLLFLDLMPFRETREYVACIARNYYWYLNLYEQERLQSKIRTPASTVTQHFSVFRTPEPNG